MRSGCDFRILRVKLCRMVLTRASGVISGVRLWPFKIFGFGRFSKKSGTHRFLGSDFFEGLGSHLFRQKSLCSPVSSENKHTNAKYLSVSGLVLARGVFGRQKSLGGLLFSDQQLITYMFGSEFLRDRRRVLGHNSDFQNLCKKISPGMASRLSGLVSCGLQDIPQKLCVNFL